MHPSAGRARNQQVPSTYHALYDWALLYGTFKPIKYFRIVAVWRLRQAP